MNNSRGWLVQVRQRSALHVFRLPFTDVDARKERLQLREVRTARAGGRVKFFLCPAVAAAVALAAVRLPRTTMSRAATAATTAPISASSAVCSPVVADVEFVVD